MTVVNLSAYEESSESIRATDASGNRYRDIDIDNLFMVDYSFGASFGVSVQYKVGNG